MSDNASYKDALLLKFEWVPTCLQGDILDEGDTAHVEEDAHEHELDDAPGAQHRAAQRQLRSTQSHSSGYVTISGVGQQLWLLSLRVCLSMCVYVDIILLFLLKSYFANFKFN